MSEASEMAKLAFKALSEKKGIDIRILDISNVSPIADYFVIASGENERQIQALCDNTDEMLGRAGFEHRSVEGYGSESWILLDYNDVIIHIFNHDDRSFYNLERIWRDAKNVDPETL